MVAKFTNNAVGTLALSISDIETSVTVSGSEGGLFPTLTGSDYFHATIVDSDGRREIIKVTARVGNTMTVERGQEGTTARAFEPGAKLSHRLTAAILNEFAQTDATLTEGLSDLQADISGGLETGGSEIAYTLTTNQDLGSLTDGDLVAARMHATSGQAPTLNVDTLGAKQIRTVYGTNVPTGALAQGGVYIFVYNSTDDAWIVHGRFADTLTSGDNPDLVAIEALEGTSGALKKTAANTWALDELTTSLVFIRDTGNANVPLTTGVLGEVQVDFACTITGVTLLADQTGNAVVDIWKDTYANYPPTDADSITSETPPTISNTVKTTDTTLTNWTKAISAGDILRFNLDSVEDITRLTVKLKVKRFG